MAKDATAHGMLVLVNLGEGTESSIAGSGIDGLVKVGLADVYTLRTIDGIQSGV